MNVIFIFMRAALRSLLSSAPSPASLPPSHPYVCRFSQASLLAWPFFLRRLFLATFVILLSLTLVLASSFARADQGDTPDIEAQRLVHILGYIAADYGGAVSGGVVTSNDEYEEQLSLAADGTKIASRLDPVLPQDRPIHLADRLNKLRELLESKADEGEVAQAVSALRAEIIGAFRLEESPPSSPNLVRGKNLYLEHCSSCHGETGHADTPRALTYTPRPANFHDPERGEAITPYRIAGMIRFGIQGTAMVPFTFLSDSDRWDIAFYVAGLRHADVSPASDAPAFALAELAIHSDAQIRNELRSAGIRQDQEAAVLSALRRRVPYEETTQSPLAAARIKLSRARVSLARGDRDAARGQLIDAYLEGIEPVEGALSAVDRDLMLSLEQRSLRLRSRLDAGADQEELNAEMEGLLREITRAEALLSPSSEKKSFASTVVASAGIVMREGVEAALLIAALLGLAAHAGLQEKRRMVHWGWMTALVLGILTWIGSTYLITISGANRELIEGVTALLATVVLFYVSYTLLAKREVARWLRFLKGQLSPRRAALSLFFISLLAAYREVFETVLFYQALLATNASVGATLLGVGVGGVVLTGIVMAYTRAGKFAPPQVFFRISGYLLYGLAIVFVGQGIAALQLAGKVPVHSLPFAPIAAIGLFPTIETISAQLVLVVLAVLGALVQSKANAGSPPKPTPSVASGGTV